MARTETTALEHLISQLSSTGVPTDDETFAPLRSICDGIVSLWGDGCEVVLHDFSDIEHSIVYVAGNVTGRHVGGPLTDLGLNVLTSGEIDQDVLSYHSRSPSEKLLKSVSILIRNKPGDEIIGAICINVEIDKLQELREQLGTLISVDGLERRDEHFANDARDNLGQMIQEELDIRGWVSSDLSRDRRRTLVHALDRRGAFAYRSAPPIIGNVLGVSRFTIYKDLKEVR